MKGRRVPPAQLGERKQYAPGQLQRSLHPNVRTNLEMLASEGYKQEGRGLLMVELDDTTDSGIKSAQYVSADRLHEMTRATPFASMQPLLAEVTRYDPAREFVVSVIDITPGLPGPQLWFDVFPRGATPEG
jgi:hypothetical protein